MNEGVKDILLKLSNLLDEHHSRSLICCDETCFCWAVSCFLDEYADYFSEPLLDFPEEHVDDSDIYDDTTNGL